MHTRTRGRSDAVHLPETQASSGIGANSYLRNMRRELRRFITGLPQPEILMRKIKSVFLLGAALLLLAGGNSLAQPGGPGAPGGAGGPGGGFGGPGGGGGGGFGGRGQQMDPAQFRQQLQDRAQEFFREQLSVTNDEEWSVIGPRISAVTLLKTETVANAMGAMRGIMAANRGATGQAGNGQAGNGQGNANRRMGGLGAFAQSTAEADALQVAIDGNLPAEQLKAAMARLREARKRKQAQLAAAEDQLREVLTVRQEAILVSLGMLD
jgi:hypothetical protein